MEELRAIDQRRTNPSRYDPGPVFEALCWDRLKDDEFERLIFNIVGDTPGYENPQWLTKTNAPDRSRDLSVVRHRLDPLSTAEHKRVLIQCKHWLARSIGPGDVSAAVTAMKLWEPPRVDVLVIATSGRFTSDAITLIEGHNRDVGLPLVEPWPDTHLERLLANRPHLVGAYGLHIR